ncbi:MAG TPA: hypothetical protein VMI52_02570, partial [Acetobacteraceae bacterium]|nr:hypothetical protein [Acetobacteraceae bacterium]
VRRLDRVSPLAVPVLLDIGRESVRTEADEDALLAETETLVAEARGERAPPLAPPPSAAPAPPAAPRARPRPALRVLRPNVARGRRARPA